MFNLSDRWQSVRSRPVSFRSGLIALRSNSFLRRAGVLSGGSAAGHVFTLAVSPLLTRLYGPRDFGGLGLFTSFLAVAGCTVALQYEASIVSAPTDGDAAYLMFASTILTVPTSILAGLALWVLIHFSLLGFGDLDWYVPVLLSSVMCFVGIFVVLRYWNLRKQEFGQVSRAVVGQSAARAILQTIGGALHLHNAGLIVGETLGRGIGMGRLFRNALPQLRACAAGFRWTECRRVLCQNWKFPLLSMPSSVMDALCVSIALPLLIHQYGGVSGGYYSLVWRAIALPGVLITLAVADTFHSEIAICARETPERVLSMFASTSFVLLVAGLIPSVVLFYWAQPLFRTIFGAQWAESGTMASLIAPWFLAQFVTNPVSRVVLVLSGQGIKLAWDLLCLLSIPAVFYFARVARLEVLHTIRILSLVNTVLYIVYFLMLLRVVINFNQKRALADVSSR